MARRKYLYIKAVILSSLLWVFPVSAGVMVSGLQCEYLSDPLGIDTATPRFNWKMTDTTNERGQRQTGYQVLVASNPALLDEGRGDIWDSHWTSSSQSALVPFAGNNL